MNKNTVELIGVYGSDLTHAQSAWTSTSRDLTEDKIERIPKLLSMLASEGHHTPFEKSTLHFLVTVDQATHIHLLKHRIGVAINGECLTGDSVITFVDTNNNTSPKLRLTIDELYHKWNNGRKHQNTEKDRDYSMDRVKNRKIRVLDEESGFFIHSNIKDLWCKGIQDVYEITLQDGKKIKCTNNHAIYTKNGYKTILDGLTTKDFVGVNGIQVAGNGMYRNYEVMKDLRDKGNSVSEIANFCDCSYHTIRKWLKIHNLKFSKDETCFRKEHSPWNKGISGYTLNISEEGLYNKNKSVKRGEDSHFWRGGVTEERNLIGAWTTNNAKKVHQKYNYTCQECGNSSDKLHAHHIIPVSTDETKAYDFDNLITVCQKCHSKIHFSNKTEMTFAEKVLSSDFIPLEKEWGKNKKKRVGNKLKIHFSKIESIKYVGKEMTYDIEVEGKNNNFVANGIIVHNSARYKELKEDKTYIPEDWNQVTETDVELFTKWDDLLKDFSETSNLLYHKALEQLTPILGRKRAKESARFFKLMNSQITMDISFNFRSFMHFQKLRNDEHAQLEVRELAQQMLELVQNIEGNTFEHTLKAFNYER